MKTRSASLTCATAQIRATFTKSLEDLSAVTASSIRTKPIEYQNQTM